MTEKERAYRTLLRLAPADLRRRHGREMEELFALRVSRRHGPEDVAPRPGSGFTRLRT